MKAPDAKVVLLDHINDVLEFATRNIRRVAPQFLKQGKVVVELADGRKGCPKQGPFDVIHMGGAIESVPKEIED